MSFIFHEPPEPSQPRRYAPVIAAVVAAVSAFSPAPRQVAWEHFEEQPRVETTRKFAPVVKAMRAYSPAGRAAESWTDAEDFGQTPRRFAPVVVAAQPQRGFNAARRLVWIEDEADAQQRRRYAPLAAFVGGAARPFAGARRVYAADLWTPEPWPDQRRGFGGAGSVAPTSGYVGRTASASFSASGASASAAFIVIGEQANVAPGIALGVGALMALAASSTTALAVADAVETDTLVIVGASAARIG
jgi:hypothetical protein